MEVIWKVRKISAQLINQNFYRWFPLKSCKYLGESVSVDFGSIPEYHGPSLFKTFDVSDLTTLKEKGILISYRIHSELRYPDLYRSRERQNQD